MDARAVTIYDLMGESLQLAQHVVVPLDNTGKVHNLRQP